MAATCEKEARVRGRVPPRLITRRHFLTVYNLAGHFIFSDNQILGDGLLSILLVRHVFGTLYRDHVTPTARPRLLSVVDSLLSVALSCAADRRGVEMARANVDESREVEDGRKWRERATRFERGSDKGTSYRKCNQPEQTLFASTREDEKYRI